MALGDSCYTCNMYIMLTLPALRQLYPLISVCVVSIYILVLILYPFSFVSVTSRNRESGTDVHSSKVGNSKTSSDANVSMMESLKKKNEFQILKNKM